MDKNEYAKQLVKRLAYMLDENEKANKVYNKIENKMSSVSGLTRYEKLEKLTGYEKQVWIRQGVIYTKSAIQRIRIELNTILLEIEKE